MVVHVCGYHYLLSGFLLLFLSFCMVDGATRSEELLLVFCIILKCFSDIVRHPVKFSLGLVLLSLRGNFFLHIVYVFSMKKEVCFIICLS
jgi:hypothetical protein